MDRIIFSLFYLIVLLLPNFSAAAAETQKTYGIALHGAPKYGPNDTPRYLNPKAPKGGDIRLGVVGAFDSLNPFVLKGAPPAGLSLLTETLVYERLMYRSHDEPFSLYGLIAESVELTPTHSAITFYLRPEAQWADGQPITAEDVQFSHKLLSEKGLPNLRSFYTRVASVDILNPRAIRFNFKKLEHENRYDPELPFLIGLMTILPKHILENQDFEQIALKPFIGSGPYRIKTFDPGRSITYERRSDYWGWRLPCNQGMYNFDRVRYDYYKDTHVALEAFKAGQYDLRGELDPRLWQTEYNFKAVQSGKVKKEVMPHALPVGMQALAFNMRRPIFADPLVRQALAYALDFEWLNKNLFHGSFKRTRSYFDNTELASRGVPTGKELALLEPYRSQLPEAVFTHEYAPPRTDDKTTIRANLKAAQQLLEKAGWRIHSGKLINVQTSQPIQFEILLYRPDDEKLALAWARNLKILGIQPTIRTVDPAQYEKRRNAYEYDVILNTWGHTLSPGREQSFYWSSKAADEPGSRNYPGIKSPVIDALCEAVATAPDRESLVTAIHALDRVLLAGYYVIPLGYNNEKYLAYWDKFGHPAFDPHVATPLMAWWTKKASLSSGK